MTDLASFQQRLYEQGLAPLYRPQELSPPFYLTNNASPNVYGPVYQENVPAYHHAPQKSSADHFPEHKGKHKCIHTVTDDKKNEKEHAKKPISEKDFKLPAINLDKLADKVHASKPIVHSLKETLDKTVEAVTAIPHLIDTVVKKPVAVIISQVEVGTTDLIDKIKHTVKDFDKGHEDTAVKGTHYETDDDELPVIETVVKKPEKDIKLPATIHDTVAEKLYASMAIANSLKEVIKKTSDATAAAVPHLVDTVVKKPAAAVSHQVEVESTKLIDKINNKLKRIQGQLSKLKLGTASIADIRSLDDSEEEGEEDVFAARSIDDVSVTPNVVHSVVGKKLRSLELDAELRGNLKTSISDAVKTAQEKFNKLIDDQVSKINNKIADITLKFETAFGKFQDALVKYPTPPLKSLATVVPKAPETKTTEKHTTINWKPKTTTTPIPPVVFEYNEKYTTPEYFKYTVPAHYGKFEDSTVADLNRMDSDAEALKIVDNAEDDLLEGTDDSTKAEPSVAEDAEKKIGADEAKSMEDLQSQVLETVKDTLKSEIDATVGAIEDNQSEVLANPVDKLNLDVVEKDIESALASELRKESDVVDENSNADDSTKKLESIAEDGEEEMAAGSQTSDDDLEKSFEIDDDIEGGIEMREIDDEEDSTDKAEADEGNE